MIRSFGFGAVMVVAAILGFALSGNYSISDTDSHGWFKRFLFSYHVSFCFVLSISVVCLFVVLILNLTRAGWGIVIRRLAEIISSVILPLLILFLPIFLITVFGGRSDLGSTLYIWNNPEFLNSNEIMNHKLDFLSPGWFGLRVLIYFTILGMMAFFFMGRSVKQDDSGAKSISTGMQRASAPCMILFAFTVVFASFDLEMSLAPRWFSTMFPVYFFAGATMGAFATLILVSNLLQNRGILADDITEDHYHDMAKLSFAFVFFWGYVAFSQFMLIWYANIPEETFWFRYRLDWQKGWAIVSIMLLFGHLFIPFLGIMSRSVRRNRQYLFGASIFLLFFHWLDHYWLVMPQFGAVTSGHITVDSNEAPGIMAFFLDLILGVGICGIYAGLIFWRAGDKPLIPVSDPRLVESLNFKNP